MSPAHTFLFESLSLILCNPESCSLARLLAGIWTRARNGSFQRTVFTNASIAAAERSDTWVKSDRCSPSLMTMLNRPCRLSSLQK